MNIVAGDSKVVMRLDYKTVNGAQGLGSHLLFLVFNYSIDAKREGKYQVRNGILEVKLKENNRSIYIGMAKTKDPMSFKSAEHTQNGQIDFMLELPPQQIESIESYRNGGGLVFEVRLYGEVTGHERDVLTKIRNSPTTVRITQSDWLNALENMRYGNTLLYEIPIPNTTSDVPEQIHQYLRKARNHYLSGNYEETIGDCRTVLDKLAEFLDDEPLMSQAKNKFLENGNSRQAMSKDERALMIRDVLRHYTHLSHHPEEDDKGIKIPYSRNEAGMILGQTASLVSFSLK